MKRALVRISLIPLCFLSPMKNFASVDLFYAGVKDPVVIELLLTLEEVVEPGTRVL